MAYDGNIIRSDFASGLASFAANTSCVCHASRHGAARRLPSWQTVCNYDSLWEDRTWELYFKILYLNRIRLLAYDSTMIRSSSASGLDLSAANTSCVCYAPRHGAARRLPSWQTYRNYDSLWVVTVSGRVTVQAPPGLVICLNVGEKMKGVFCGRRDLNPHASRRQNLNLVRLPISPRPHCGCISRFLY